MEEYKASKRCFVIGPMRDMARLNTLAYQVVKPLLEPYGYIITTPDMGEIGAIMHQVLLNLEQADILVADITGNNPNVMYELGIYHSFGKPYVAVSERNKRKRQEATPFDIAAFRFVEIDLTDPAKSIEAIRPLLTSTIEKMDELDWFENPVTVFYNSPIAEIPTAIGLFKNYSRNFIEQILPDLFSRHEESNDYLFSVWVHEPNHEQANKDGYIKLMNDSRRKLKFEVIIPSRMFMAEHSYLKALKDENEKFIHRNARVIKKSRTFEMHYRKTEDGNYILSDFPTVLASLNESIATRRRIHERNIDSREWRILEVEELSRFAKKCNTLISRMIAKSPQAIDKIEVVEGWQV